MKTESVHKPLVLFGCGKIAEVVLQVLKQAGDREVVAVCADREFLPGDRWQGLPTVAFEDLPAQFPPDRFDLFVALGYQQMNRLRADKCQAARALGYTLASVIDPVARLPADSVHGDNCFFMGPLHVHPCVSFGSNVFMWSGAIVGHHSSIGDNCWITSGASIAGVVDVGQDSFFAINSTVAHGVKVGARCFVGANALITRATEDDQVFVVESTKPQRLTSAQFFRMSRIGDL